MIVGRCVLVACLAFAAGGLAVYALRPAPLPVASVPTATVSKPKHPLTPRAVTQAPPPREAKRTIVPLSEIYTTSWQPELAGHLPLPEKRRREGMELLRHHATRHGSANVFLVPAFTPSDVIWYTKAVYGSGLAAEMAYRGRDDHHFRDKNDTPAPLWVCVALPPGHSSPPKWEVHSVVCEGNRVRFNYSRPDTWYASADVEVYFYWFRLPTPEREDYLFELFDRDQGEVMLSRRMFLQPARPPEPDDPEQLKLLLDAGK